MLLRPPKSTLLYPLLSFSCTTALLVTKNYADLSPRDFIATISTTGTDLPVSPTPPTTENTPSPSVSLTSKDSPPPASPSSTRSEGSGSSISSNLPPSTFASTPSSSSSSAPQPSSSEASSGFIPTKPKTGLIAAGAIGALALLAILAVLFYCLRRRNRNRNRNRHRHTHNLPIQLQDSSRMSTPAPAGSYRVLEPFRLNPPLSRMDTVYSVSPPSSATALTRGDSESTAWKEPTMPALQPNRPTDRDLYADNHDVPRVRERERDEEVEWRLRRLEELAEPPAYGSAELM